MIGSNWPEPLQAQSGRGSPRHAAVDDTSSAIHGLGQLPGHGFGPYRVVSM